MSTPYILEEVSFLSKIPVYGTITKALSIAFSNSGILLPPLPLCNLYPFYYYELLDQGVVGLPGGVIFDAPAQLDQQIANEIERRVPLGRR